MDKFQIDLTQGKVAKNLIRFSLPFLAANFLQAMYNLSDMLIVGRFNGAVGASAIGVGGQMTFLVLNIISGLAVGGTVIIAQFLGSKQESKLKQTLGTIFTLYAMAAAAFTAIMLIFNPLLVRSLTSGSPMVYDDTLKYVNICTAGNIFIFGYNAVSAILRGMGDSKHPLVFVGIAAVLNIALDLLFVWSFGMGAAGAALATIISQAFSFVISIIFLKKKNFIFDFKLKSFKIDKTISKEILKIGLPASLQGALVTASFMILTVVADRIAGIAGVTAISVVGKVNSVAILPALAMQMSVSSIAGQNLGANKPDRALKTMLSAVVITLSLSVVMYAIASIFAEPIVKIFIGNESQTLTPEETAECLRQSAVYLKHMSLDYLVVSVIFNISGLAMAAGHTRFSLMCGVVSSIAFRIPASVLLGITLGLGMSGLGYAAPIASACASVIGIIYVLTGAWKKSKVNINAGNAAAEPII
ncbi:MAG: MATE family efflux transporter [Clostridiales bacterium]|jgi:putative MATE family efflux protein|nr:MATE family efflux transporter [Clostridiales bacterium]